jgi:tRNA pseudouridine38-40 synthase
VSRTYRYSVVHFRTTVGEAALRSSPLTDRFALFETRSLDLEAMQQATGMLVGEHDFATFGQATQGESTVRRVERAAWQAVHCDLPELDPYPGQRLVFTVTANGFLRQMVRSLVGTLLAVGLGQWSPQDVEAALAARDRSRSAPLAPAHGLVLERVHYPEELERLFRFWPQSAPSGS